MDFVVQLASYLLLRKVIIIPKLKLVKGVERNTKLLRCQVQGKQGKSSMLCSIHSSII